MKLFPVTIVMGATKSFYKSSKFPALGACSFFPVKQLMLVDIRNNKILDSVVRFYPVDVMNLLARIQVAPKFLFHYKSVLVNIASVLNMGMVLGTDKNIAMRGGELSPFPRPIKFRSGFNRCPPTIFASLHPAGLSPFFYEFASAIHAFGVVDVCAHSQYLQDVLCNGREI